MKYFSIMFILLPVLVFAAQPNTNPHPGLNFEPEYYLINECQSVGNGTLECLHISGKPPNLPGPNPSSLRAFIKKWPTRADRYYINKSFPEQINLSGTGYLLLIACTGIVFLIITAIRLIFIKRKTLNGQAAGLFLGYPLIAFLSMLIMTFFLSYFELHNNIQIYMVLGKEIAPVLLSYTLLLITTLVGLYAYFTMVLWSMYKLHNNKGLTPFMISLVLFADRVKKMTKM